MIINVSDDELAILRVIRERVISRERAVRALLAIDLGAGTDGRRVTMGPDRDETRMDDRSEECRRRRGRIVHGA